MKTSSKSEEEEVVQVEAWKATRSSFGELCHYNPRLDGIERQQFIHLVLWQGRDIQSGKQERAQHVQMQIDSSKASKVLVKWE